MNNLEFFREIEADLVDDDAEMARRLLALSRAPSLALIARVQSIAGQPERREWAAPRLAWGLAVVVLLAVILVAASPTLQAALGVMQEAIGDVYLAVTDRLFEHSEVVTVPLEWMSLEAARTAVSFEFELPGWAPAGWSMEKLVGVGHLDGIPSVQVEWSRPEHSDIFLIAQPILRLDSGLPLQTLVGEGSFEEIEISGQPAVLVKGGWDNASRAWAHPDVTTILWAGDGVTYSLVSSDPKVSPEDLVEMAASAH